MSFDRGADHMKNKMSLYVLFGLSNVTFFKVDIRLTITTRRGMGVSLIVASKKYSQSSFTLKATQGKHVRVI